MSAVRESKDILIPLINESKLPPLKGYRERKTFATTTLKQIKSRLQYYRKILSQPYPTDEKKIAKREKIQRKYDHNIKVRYLLNRAVNNLYI
mgnify:CR=1 FL=1